MQRIFDSRQLLAFITLARLGSFTQTAKELALTQSAISHAIKTLEEDVGCRLVERNSRKAVLTQAGEVFLAHAERSLGSMNAAREELDAMSIWGQGRLRIGASSTSCQYILPTVLREFRQCFPKCAISIESGDQPRQLELLLNNQIDIALMLEPLRYRELDFIPLFEDELRFVVPPAHPWAKAGRASTEAAATETFLTYHKNSATSRMIGEHLRLERIQPGATIELSSMEAIKELVRVGVGVGVLAPWVCKAELAQGILVSLPMGKHALKRNWGIAHVKGRSPRLGEEVFIGLCKTVTEPMG